jgi:hypothetical protein
MARATGLRGLAIQRASTIATERASKTGATGFDLVAVMAADMTKHLADDMRAGMAFATEAVRVVRAAPDYNPAVHGRTDDEIADVLLAHAAKRGRV